jgi:hypothetical protein
MSVRPFSVVLGLSAAVAVSVALWLVAAVVCWVARLPLTGYPLWVLSLTILSLSQCVGGYVAARLSDAKTRAALAVGLVTVCITAGAILFRPSGVVWWMTATSLTLVMSSVYVGGRLAQRSATPSAAPPDVGGADDLYRTWDASRRPADLRTLLDRLETAESSCGPGSRDTLVARYPALDGQPEFEALAEYLESSR